MSRFPELGILNSLNTHKPIYHIKRVIHKQVKIDDRMVLLEIPEGGYLDKLLKSEGIDLFKSNE